ncbi:hypothetical protein K443DRAFT_292060 [Laccaria amethystina LaAM-08-1]|uniref:Uncharacterized protein n=1 Tax=Laccaria amethystina LaAM-08-1 TaxID=1095629 RepID=A0A0C9XJ38_9AGAR|nr:hypothetical protein K443DRAFT_292060 [Laccaria amethystina LaAM-08-1]
MVISFSARFVFKCVWSDGQGTRDTLKAGLRFPPLWDLLGHIVRHTTRSSERVDFGQEHTPGSRTKLDTGEVEGFRLFKHVSSGRHLTHF